MKIFCNILQTYFILSAICDYKMALRIILLHLINEDI